MDILHTAWQVPKKYEEQAGWAGGQDRVCDPSQVRDHAHTLGWVRTMAAGPGPKESLDGCLL